jgi:tetratricopeptide (TPR) repeat protein
LCAGAAAQKKDIATAQENVKKGTNLDKAEQTMVNLLKDSAQAQNVKVWSILFDALRKQYEQGNEKLYLKQKYDTAALFNTASRMFQYMVRFDSIDARPDSKGKVKLAFRKDHASMLNTLRPNLFNGGLYYLQKQKYAEAYKLFDQYIDTSVQPMFAGYHYAEYDLRMPEAAYWAAYSAYKMNDAKKTLQHTYLALKDTAHYKMMLQYLAAIYRQEKDTTRYLDALKEGFAKYPLETYFFSNLIDYYASRNSWDSALLLTDQALKQDSTREMFWLTKSSVLLNLGEYEQSFVLSDSLLQKNDSLTEAYLNAGLAKFNLGVTLDKTTQHSLKAKRTILNYYTEALPYLEKYRKLQPEKTDKWALPLYTIYLNLNKGKEFDEIDKLLRK